MIKNWNLFILQEFQNVGLHDSLFLYSQIITDLRLDPNKDHSLRRRSLSQWMLEGRDPVTLYNPANQKPCCQSIPLWHHHPQKRSPPMPFSPRTLSWPTPTSQTCRPLALPTQRPTSVSVKGLDRESSNARRTTAVAKWVSVSVMLFIGYRRDSYPSVKWSVP